MNQQQPSNPKETDQLDEIKLPAPDDEIASVEVSCVDQADDEQGPPREILKIRVGTNLKNRRLDKYLGGRFNQFSRSRLQKMIKNQGVLVNSQLAKVSHKLNPGDIVELSLPKREFRELIPEDIPLDIMYEDDEMIVLNKQANLIVHPARGHKQGTLVNALVFHANQLSKGTEDFRPGIVHRLDRNTTGVMVVAKTDTAQYKLSQQFQKRTIKKTYIAIVHGVPELTADRINQPLGVHPSVREKYSIRADGKESVTFYEVLEEFRGYSLVKLRLMTGRTHQLRVHMSHLKHSIVADDMYGGKVVYPWQIEDRDAEPEEPLMARVALHAWQLKLTHPTSEETMSFEADLPADMQNFLDKLREYRKV